MSSRKRGRGGVDDDGDDGGGADNTHADDDHASAAAPPHPLDMTPAGGGTAQAAAWGLTSAPSLRRQHALNAWAIMRAAASMGDAPAAASAAALALRAPAPPAEAGAALAGLPPGWAALAGARPEQAPPNPAALTGAGRATVLAVGLDALRTVAAAAAGRGQGGGVTRLDLTRAARARVAAAPPATPAGGAASLALALELASQGDTPQALAVLDAHAAAVAAKRAAAGGRGGGGGGGGGGGASATAPLLTRPPDPATLAALAALRYATWEAGRRGDVSAGSAALAALTAAAGGGGGGGAGPAALAAALHLSSGGGGGGAASAGSRPALDRATDVADATLTFCPRDADAAALRLLLLAADPPGASNGQEQAGAALALLRCTPRSGRALGAVLASVVPAKAACAHIRAEAGARFLEASGGRPAAGSAPRSRAVRAAWVALAAGAGDLVAGLALSASSSSDGEEEEGGDAARDRPPPPSVSAPALAALRSRAAAWAEAGRPFDPSTLPGLRPQDPAVPASRLRLGAYALADRGVAGALVGGPGGAAFAAAVLGALDAETAVNGGDDDAPAAAARVRRALAEAERLEEALPPPWRLTVPHSGGAGPAAGPAPPAPRPQRTHPATGRLVDLPPSYFASFPPSLRRRAAG